MDMSDQVDALLAALSKAQASIQGALKDSSNPFFKSKYADLASVWDAVRGPLTDNGLCVIQTVGSTDGGVVTICTLLGHASGQWILDTLPLTPKDSSPQAVGSAITYGRRYALASITGCPQIDDDGNEASKPVHSPRDGLEKADPGKVQGYANRVADMLAADLTEGEQADSWFEIHREIYNDHATYSALQEELKAKKLLGAAQIKALTTLGSKRYQSRQVF